MACRHLTVGNGVLHLVENPALSAGKGYCHFFCDNLYHGVLSGYIRLFLYEILGYDNLGCYVAVITEYVGEGHCGLPGLLTLVGLHVEDYSLVADLGFSHPVIGGVSREVSALDGILYRIGDSKLSALGKGCEGAVADVDYRIRSRFDVAITAGECSCGRKSGKEKEESFHTAVVLEYVHVKIWIF